MVKKFWSKLSVFLGYNASSLFTFLLELGVLYLCNTTLYLPYYFAVPIAFISTTLVQYIICHFWVFNKSGRVIALEWAYFMSILTTGLLLTLLQVTLLVQVFGLAVITSRVLAGILTALWDFYLNARFNFRARAFMPHKK